MNKAKRWIAFAILLVGAGVVVWVYSPASEAGFYFDDVPNIVDVPELHWQKLTPQGFGEVARGVPLKRRLVSYWSFALNHLGSGLDPASFRIVNLWIHIAVGLSLAWVAWLYAQQDGSPRSERGWAAVAAAIVAMLFLLHPLNIQAVTYIVQRMSALAALFCLWSFGLYLLGRRSSSRSAALVLFGLSGMCWILALGSKENALALPAVIALFEVCFYRQWWVEKARSLRAGGRAWVLILAVVALAAAGWLIYVVYLEAPRFNWTDQLPGRDFSLSERVLTQLRVGVFYLTLLVWPAPSRLNLDHDFSISRSLVDPLSTLVTAVFWLALLVFLVALARRKPRYAFPPLAYMLFHAIEAGPVNLELVFEHRMYLPMTALALLLTVTLVDLSPRRRIVATVGVVALLPMLAGATYRRNLTWADFIAFHLDCVRKSPEKYRPHLNLGTELGRLNRSPEAIPYLERAVELRPDISKAHNQLGSAYLRLQRYSEAMVEVRQAVSLDPDNAYARHNLGYILDRLGHPGEAIPHYRHFLAVAPEKLSDFIEPVERRLRELESTTRIRDPD